LKTLLKFFNSTKKNLPIVLKNLTNLPHVK
jgi:hypothetical protein